MIRHHRPRVLTTPTTARTRRAERGAALVELSIVAVLMLALVAGAFDYGFAWRSGLTANEAARAGARVGSGQATSPGADYYALNGVRSTLVASGEIDRVQKVIIFKSTTADGAVPSSCRLASPTGTCNVLTGTQLKNLTASSFTLTLSDNPSVKPTGTGCLKSSAALRAGWCPNARSNNLDTGADYYGVFVELKYMHKFAPTGSFTMVRRTAVMRLEPTSFGG